MGDERTDEQKVADKLLDAAFEAQAVAYTEGTRGVVTGSIGVYATTYYSDDGEPMTRVGICTPDGNTTPYHVAIGLLKVASDMYRARVIEPGDED
jgi:hypothetical protein